MDLNNLYSKKYLKYKKKYLDLKRKLTAGASLGAEEGSGSQAEEPQYYINIININTGRRIKYFPVRSESWEEIKNKLQRQGYTELYDFDDDKDGDVNILEYDEEGFNQKYGAYPEINAYSKTTPEPTRPPRQEPRKLEFIQFGRKYYII